MKKLFLTSILFIGCLLNLSAQIDNTFWFTVPEVTWRHSPTGGEPTYIKITSYGHDAQVTLSMPAEPSFTPISMTIEAGSTEIIDLTGFIRTDYVAGSSIGTANDNNIIESGLPYHEGQIENRGFLLKSDNLITAYLERNNSLNPEIFALKGANALGTEFRIPGQNYFNNYSFQSPKGLNAFDIVASENGTTIQITPSQPIILGLQYWNAGNTYYITLNKGQSISCVALNENKTSHLGGSLVTSDKPIAIMWKDDSVRSDFSGCFDLLGDQLIPNNKAGTEYVVVRGESTNTSEFAFITTIEDYTTITLTDANGTRDTLINSAGDIYRDLLNGELVGIATSPTIDYLYISSDKPIMVLHITGFGCEIGAAVLPPVNNCKGTYTVNFQRSDPENTHLNLLCKGENINDFTITIDGTDYSIPGSWFTEIPGSGTDAASNFWYLDKAYNNFSSDHGGIPALNIGQTTKISNASGLFHLGILNGGTTTGVRYGYFSNFSSNLGNTFFNASYTTDYIKYCYGDTIPLHAIGGINYTWNYTSTPYLSNTFIDDPNAAKTRVCPPPGFHTYNVNITRSCYYGANQDTTIIVSMYGYPEIKADFDTLQFKEANSNVLKIKYLNQSVGANKFEWTFERQYDTLNFITTDPEPVYYTNSSYSLQKIKSKLKASYINNCPDTTSKLISVKPRLTPKINKGSYAPCLSSVPVTFAADTSGAGPITHVYWNWGDGSCDTLSGSTIASQIEHRFINETLKDTTFYVMLTVFDSLNQNSIFSIDSVFVPGKAKANFSLSDAYGCSPLSVQITNQSEGDVSYEWSFYDGNSDSKTIDAVSNFTDTVINYLNQTDSIIHYYNYLQVIKQNIDGSTCIDTYGPDTIAVSPIVDASFEYELTGSQSCGEAQVSITNSTVGANGFVWKYNNQIATYDETPEPFVFENQSDTVQTYTIQLNAFNAYCVDSLTSSFTLDYATQLQVSATTTELCSNEPFNLWYSTNAQTDSVIWTIDENIFIFNQAQLDYTFENNSNTTDTHKIIVTVYDTIERNCFKSDSLFVLVNNCTYLDLGNTIKACDSDSVLISAPDTYLEYLWSNKETTSEIYAKQSAYYSLRVLNEYGKYEFDSVYVHINNLPSSFLPNDTNFCFGDTIQITIESNDLNYKWNNGSESQSLEISEPGTYIASISDSMACTFTDTITLSLHTQNTIELGEPIAACDGDTLKLKTNFNYVSYLWNTSSCDSVLEVTESNIYSVFVTDSNGCTYSDSIAVTFNPLPIVNLGADINKCIGQSVLLKPSEGFSKYKWNTNDTTSQLIVNKSGTYTVEVSDAFNCKNTDSVLVVFHDLPVVNLGADIVACADSLVFLSPGNEFTHYTWNTGSSDSIILASSTAFYSVKVMDSLACANSDTIHVTINNLPSIDLADYESKCEGDSITLQAPLNQFAYLWNTNDTTSQLIVNKSGTYTVEVTDAFNCKNIDSVLVVFHDLPAVNLGADIVACEDSLVFLSPGNEFTHYTWNTGSSDSIILASSTAFYSVKVMDSLACTNSDTIHVTINNLPSIDLADYESKCEGDSITLQAPLNQFAYLWNTNDTTSQLIVNKSGTYTIEVTDAFNCKNTDSTRVEFLQNPISKLASDTAACMGDTLLIDGGIFEKYIWSDASNNRILEVTKSGLYTVQLFDKNQCSVTDSIDVVFYELPLANFSFNEDKGLVSFFNTSINANSYLWYFGDSIGTSQEEHPVYVYNENGFYPVILIAYSNHCGESQADSTIVISGVSIDYDEADFRIYPNPTNDWLIIERETNFSKKLSIEIFNSNGELVISKKTSGKNLQISLASFTNGIYIIKILESDKIMTFKVLKN